MVLKLPPSVKYNYMTGCKFMMERDAVIESLASAYFGELRVATKHRMFGEVEQAHKSIDYSNGILKAGEALGIERSEIKHKYMEMERMKHDN